MPFDMEPIENSSNLVSAGYDEGTETLRVQFKGGSEYDYHGVPAEMHKAFREAPSQGSYLHSIIKTGCPASRVEKEPTDASI